MSTYIIPGIFHEEGRQYNRTTCVRKIYPKTIWRTIESENL